MKRKSILIIVVVLLLVVGTCAGAVTYAVWDSKKSDLSIDFNTGGDYRITVNMQKSEPAKNFRPNSPLANPDSSSETIVSKFDLTIKEYSAVEFKIGDIYLKASNMTDEQKINANAFMAVTIYEGDTINPEKVIPANGKLKANTTYIITFKFTVDSSSDLLATDMQHAEIFSSIDFTGVAQGGNA